jgi:hypothetical protein
VINPGACAGVFVRALAGEAQAGSPSKIATIQKTRPGSFESMKPIPVWRHNIANGRA